MQNEKPKSKLKLGNCLDVLKTMPDNYVDSIVTDPPYGLSFMGKKWDYDVPSKEIWAECLRVLKPGGHLLAFGGTRTYHRLVVAIEDAGFEIRDQIQWLTGQGFPKSLNVKKAAIKEGIACGCEEKSQSVGQSTGKSEGVRIPKGALDGTSLSRCSNCEKPIFPEGFGSALKPANEPICLARKPLSESTLAKNVLKHGTGGLNIDGTRVDFASETDRLSAIPGDGKGASSIYSSGADGTVPWKQGAGRFPANVIFDEDAAKVLDEQSGVLKTGGDPRKTKQASTGLYGMGKNIPTEGPSFAGDSGGASRFFYVAKASKSDRGEGNIHPTVKPVKLMEYLIKLITPPNGIVLDPFMGSGTTGVAAANLSVRFVGCEMSDEYFEIAKKRIENA